MSTRRVTLGGAKVYRVRVGQTVRVTTQTKQNRVRITAGTIGPTGPVGATGPAGAVGEGVPAGGTINQVLAKLSATDYDTGWVDAAVGGGAVDSVFGRTGIVVADAGDYDTITDWLADSIHLGSGIGTGTAGEIKFSSTAGRSIAFDDDLDRFITTGDWANDGQMYLNHAGLLSTAYMYFGNNSSPTAANFNYSTADDWFTFSAGVRASWFDADHELASFGIVSDAQVRFGDPFDAGSETVYVLRMSRSNNRFEFDNALHVGGGLTVSAITATGVITTGAEIQAESGFLGDSIDEVSANAGVTVDGLLIKDGAIAVAGVTGALAAASNLSDVAAQQTALDNVTAVAGATNEFVLTKDTGTGNAVWKVAAGGGGAVDSVNTQTGVVVLNTSHISEVTNLYYTEVRVSANTNVAANTAARHTHANIAVLDATTASFLSAQETKLAGIATGAQVNTVDSVNGDTGVVVLTTSDIAEGTNLYYTEVRVSANTEVSANTSARHTHANIAVLDATTASFLLADETKLDGIATGAEVNAVDSVFSRTGAVVAATNDYTWAQVDKTISSLADITTRSHTVLADIGTNTHAQLDTHLALVNEHIDWTNATQNFLTTGIITGRHTDATANTQFFSDVDMTTSGVFSGNLIGLDVDHDVTLGVATTNVATVTGLRYTLNLIDNGASFNILTLNPISTNVNAGGINVSDVPAIEHVFTNPVSTQAFSNGYFRVTVTGGTGTTIAAYMAANVSGAGTGIGFRGYAACPSSGTGNLIGVNAYLFPNSSAVLTTAVAFDASYIAGGATPMDRRSLLRGANMHVLVGGSGIFADVSLVSTAAAITTTHLDFLNNKGELYSEGNAEVDGELFADGNESHSLVETTTTPYTAATVTYIMVDATAGNKVVDLPAISTLSGNREYVVKKIDSTANTVTVDGNASETIDGATTAVLTTQYDKVRVINGSTEWHDVT